jgi:hypothetical protein
MEKQVIEEEDEMTLDSEVQKMAAAMSKHEVNIFDMLER